MIIPSEAILEYQMQYIRRNHEDTYVISLAVLIKRESVKLK